MSLLDSNWIKRSSFFFLSQVRPILPVLEHRVEYFDLVNDPALCRKVISNSDELVASSSQTKVILVIPKDRVIDLRMFFL